ncbi:type II secretion system protein J, partial [Staphylococcus aureus]|uniref:PulJ/GspJ family protein n=1 Tax=Staphylococcus aureus TaxID=1280 RepID=UPI0039BE38A9
MEPNPAKKNSFIKRSSHGFTIVEVLVYLGLFGLIMVGIVATAYNIFETSGRLQTRAMLTAEGNFLLGKINWAMNGATAIAV